MLEDVENVDPRASTPAKTTTATSNPRAMQAFLFFVADVKAQVGGRLTGTELSAHVAQQWRSLSTAEKDRYKRLAQA